MTLAGLDPALWLVLLLAESVALAVGTGWLLGTVEVRNAPLYRLLAAAGTGFSIIAVLVLVAGLSGATPVAGVAILGLALVGLGLGAAGVILAVMARRAGQLAGGDGTDSRYWIGADRTQFLAPAAAVPQAAQAAAHAAAPAAERSPANDPDRTRMQRVPPASAPPGQRRAWPRPGFLVEQAPGGHVHRLLWETTIGRSTDSTTQVSINHPTVSFHHASIRFEDNYFVVRDLQSKNGTFLLRDGREERITTAPLRHGDIVRLGWDQPLSGPVAKPPPTVERGAVYLAFLDSAGHVQ